MSEELDPEAALTFDDLVGGTETRMTGHKLIAYIRELEAALEPFARIDTEGAINVGDYVTRPMIENAARVLRKAEADG